MPIGANLSRKVIAEPYGVSREGRPVTAHTLVNSAGTSVTILDYGGTITQVRVPDRNGRLGNVVMGFNDLAAWETLAHVNAITGRFANRIRGGFTLDGTHYRLPADGQGVSLHGGPDPYSTRIWTVEPPADPSVAALTLRLESPDGDQGFPGHLIVRATYRFSDDNVLRLDFEARTDRATPINLTNHVYFNLAGDTSRSIADHDLQILADAIAVTDPALIPTGVLEPVAGTPNDLTRPTRLGRRQQTSGATPTPGSETFAALDTPFVLRPEARELKGLAARLHDPQSGRVLEVRTTEPSIQVYTIDQVPPGLLSEADRPFARFPAVALETQHLPDSPNRPEFPNTILHPGEVFRSTTLFAFGVDEA